jgi:hypothetical protein
MVTGSDELLDKSKGEQDPRAVMKEKKYHMLTIAHGTSGSGKR